MSETPDPYETLYRSLTNIRPDDYAVESIELLREQAKFLGRAILDGLEPSRERSLALTKLEECLMWVVKGLVLQNPAEESTEAPRV